MLTPTSCSYMKGKKTWHWNWSWPHFNSFVDSWHNWIRLQASVNNTWSFKFNVGPEFQHKDNAVSFSGITLHRTSLNDWICKWILHESGERDEEIMWRKRWRHNLHHLWVYYELTTCPSLSWLDSSVGRALHRYSRGHGFKFQSRLNFFRLLVHNCSSCVYNCDDQSCLHIVLRSSNVGSFI